MDKYFIPDKSDLRIGYECEVFTDKWEKVKLNQKTGLQISVDLVNIGRYKIRTRYMTKEDIEKEGWYQCYDNGLYSKPSKNNPKNYWELGLDYNLHYIDLYSVIDEGKQGERRFCRYDGNCSSINEFRYITKLLNV